MNRNEMRMTGILLLLLPLMIVLSWTGLMISFEYPDILRKPIEVILQTYEEGGLTLKLYWIGMVVSSLLIIPVVMLFYRLTSQTNRSLSLAAAGVGLASAIFHVLGFARWLFAVDYLATQYAEASHSTSIQKETIEIVFHTLHMYLGVTVGETLGFATMGIWAILTAITLCQAGFIPKWAMVLSIGSGIGILAGILEWAGLSASVEINAYAYQMWLLILACLAISFILKSRK